MSARAAFGLAVALLAMAPAPAAAQACCAAPSLVAPVRLRRDERWAAGLESRARVVYGDFAADGAFSSTSSGDVETEQDPFVAARVLERAQIALVVPFVQTRRTVPGLTGWGGGLGDVRASLHLELTQAGARRWVPGLALLLGLSAPTGTAPDEARDPLAADATGTGAYEGTVGLELDQRFERAFVIVSASVAQRAPRVAAGVRETFAPELAAVVSGGAVFEGDRVVGAFVSGSRAGAARDSATGAAIPGSERGLATLGLGAELPFADGWRARATASLDCPVSGLGRNQGASAGLAVSALRAWH